MQKNARLAYIPQDANVISAGNNRALVAKNPFTGGPKYHIFLLLFAYISKKSYLCTQI